MSRDPNDTLIPPDEAKTSGSSGRRPRRSGSNRTVTKAVRFTEQEWAQVDAAIGAGGFRNFSEFGRFKTLAPDGARRPSRPKDFTGLIAAVNRLANHLARLGNNINQLTRAANAGKTLEHALIAELNELRPARAEARKTLQRVLEMLEPGRSAR